MKILEVLVNNEIVQYDETAPRGKRWLVVDESSGRVKSVHATKESANQTAKTKPIVEKKIVSEAATNSGIDFPLGEIFPIGGLTGPQRYAIGLGTVDEIIEFNNLNDANRFKQSVVNTFPENQRTSPPNLAFRNKLLSAVLPEGAEVRDIKGLSLTLSRRAAAASATSMEALGNITRIGPSLRNFLNSPYARGIARILGAAGIVADMYFTNMEIINDLEIEAEAEPNKREANYELRNIVIAQMHLQIFIMLYQIFRTASLFNRALSAIKWTVRAAQGAGAVSGIGTIPSLLSILVTESAWLVAGFIISSETVQRGLAEWLRDSMFSQVFQLTGQTISLAATALDAAFDSKFGTGAFRRGLGWDSQDAEAAPEGEVVTSSEWAKLVFHGLLFPPGREQQLVPYINPQERARLLRSAMGLEEQTEPAEPTAQTSEPGMPTNPDAVPGPQ